MARKLTWLIRPKHSEESVGTKGVSIVRLVVFIGISVMVGLVMAVSGVEVWGIVVSVVLLGALLWCFGRRPPSKDEQPNSSVSCCHYLGNLEE